MKKIEINLNALLNLLEQEKSEGYIDILYRGLNKKMAFEILGLDYKLNNIKKFKERIFLYGTKARYFWNESLRNKESEVEFALNDISDEIFTYIFNNFQFLLKEKKCSNFFNKNIDFAKYFHIDSNLRSFLEIIKKIKVEERVIPRNYYLQVLHQLQNTKYTENSHFVSSTSDVSIANDFAGSDGIVVNFWLPNLKNFENNFPKLIEMPYKSENETSVLGGILPHYIYSFTYKNKTHINPAIEKIKNPHITILTGLEIDQTEFKKRNKSGYAKGFETDGLSNNEFKISNE